MRESRGNEGGRILFSTTKTVNLCHPGAQLLRSGFISSSASDNPTVTETDSAKLMHVWQRLSFVFVSASLFLSWLIRASVRTNRQTHDSMISGLQRESASAHATSVVVWAQQVLDISLLLSSVLRVLECAVLHAPVETKTSHWNSVFV